MLYKTPKYVTIYKKIILEGICMLDKGKMNADKWEIGSPFPKQQFVNPPDNKTAVPTAPV